MISRRKFVTGGMASMALIAGLAAGTFAGDMSAAPARAAVYRGRGAGSCDGCSEAVARLLGSGPVPFQVEFIGPDESRKVSLETLSEMVVYAQPGGGDVAAAWRHLRDDAETVRQWVSKGGNYLGFCLGAYLAGSDPGYGLFPGRVYRYIDSPEAAVESADYTTVETEWDDKTWPMYFQDGPTFDVSPGAPARVIATYPAGEPAAVVATYGLGRIGVIGPHPEADLDWFDATFDKPQDAVNPVLGHRLISETLDL